MQLNSILDITGAMLQGSGESPADADANVEALLPFAAVLSGTLSLLTPEQAPAGEAAQGEAAGETNAGTTAADALIEHLASGESDLIVSTGQPSEPATPSTLLPAVDEVSEGIRPANMPAPAASPQRQASEGVSLRYQAPTPGLAGTAEGTRQATVPQATVPQATVPQAAVPQATVPQAAAREALPLVSAPPEASGELAQATSEIVRPLRQEGDQAGIQTLEISAEGSSEAAELERAVSDRRPASREVATSDVAKKAVSVKQTVEPASQPVVQASKEPAAPGVSALETAEVLPELEAALPDLEGATPEKTTETATSSREKAAAIDVDGGDVSADAGGDSDTKKDDARRARRIRRAEAEPAAVRKFEQSAVEQTRLKETAASQAEASLEPPPEQPVAENAASADLDPGPALAEEHIAPPTSDKSTADAATGRARAARGLFQQNRTMPVAWLRAVLNNARQAVFSEDGWKVLEMNLDDGDGTVTIKARREEGRVAVAVGFSDPELRALASSHADRLQEALQAEYETAVDFSLFSDNADDSGARQQSDGARAAVGPAAGVDADADTHDSPAARRSLPAGAQHEWVG